MLKKIAGVVFFFLSIAHPQIISSQWAKFANYNDATSITANNDSVVWIGTKAGLVKWDINNNTYKIYNKTNGLPSVVINDLKFDKKGNLWLASNNGIEKYDGSSFTLYNYQNTQMPEAPFTKIAIDSNGNIYASMGWYTKNNIYFPGGVVEYTNGVWKIFYINNNLGGQANPPSDIIVFNNKLWICDPVETHTWETVFYNIINDNLVQKSSIQLYINNLTIDYQDSLWAGCGLQLYKWRNNSFAQIIGENSGLGSVWYYAWSNGYDGLWLGGSGPYLYYLNITDNLKGIKLDSNLPPGLKQIFYHLDPDTIGTFTNQFAISKDKQLFVSRNGLNLYNHYGVLQRSFRVPKTITDNNIYGLGISPQNNIIVSGPYSTQEYNGKNWISLGDEYTGQRAWNNNFCFTPNGNLYTNHNKIYGNWDSYSGFTHGADVDLNGNLWTSYGDIIEYKWPPLLKDEYTLNDMGITTNAGYYSPQFMDITIDKFNRVWADGWYGDAVMFDGTNWHIYKSADVGLRYGWNADYIFTDSKGRVWFTTNQWSPNEGIVLNNYGKWSIITFNDYPQASYVYQITEDNFGNLWFATGAGLLEYTNSNWYIFNSNNSQLDVSDIRAVAADRRGNIWVGTTLGLYIYNPQGLDFNSDITSSPVDFQIIYNYENGVEVKFKPNESASPAYRYELQRGNLPFKYWTVSSIDLSTQNSDTLQLIDSSAINGDYYYRIKEIDTKGKALYSPTMKYTGNGQNVLITDFKGIYLGDKIGFSWQCSNEHFISYYEITQYDSLTNKDSILSLVKAKNNGDENYQIITGDLLSNSKLKEYRLIAVYADSSKQILKTTIFSPTIPSQFELSQNYPNPFNGQTSIDFKLPQKEYVVFKVYDILGKLISIPIRKEYTKGYYTINLNLLNLASGVYIYELTAGTYRNVKKMVLLK